MNFVVVAIWGAFIGILQSLVGRILVYLSIGYFTYTGVDILMDSVRLAALSNLGQVADVLVGVVGMMKIEESLNVLLSATVAKYAMAGLTNGSFTRVGVK